ncbi:glycosyltransferase family 4 protein [Marivirga arenosa]|uniref:Glycosyltransferase family 4 protein n=1 Tax=Marivirga arenosa TaxID=3059076 RepID=A0AA49JCM4_9BACT|nr:glycosyltransferase family 4 protein [Marivirga sp. BKB1-2]WKK80796.2 glycosyltransferase family 4 protein [Marivirga sp. BKB1-2]
MKKILRITTVPISLNILLTGQLKYMREQGYEVITASADGPEVQEVCDREGVKHYKINFTRILSPLQDLRALIQLIRLIRDEKPDIVHTHTPKAGLLGMLAARICSVKCRMHTVAGMPLMEASGLTRRILRVTEKVTYFCAQKVYPNSYRLKEYMETAFPSYQSKFKIIGEGSSNGINTDYFSTHEVSEGLIKKVQNDYKIPLNSTVFVFVGRLVEDKGIHDLVKAFKNIEANSYLILVGAFEDEREAVNPEIKSEIENNCRIIHVGFQKDIRPFLAASDIFVFPSYREGFPNVVLQAASMGLPSIVSDINGSNEIITHGENGLIVPVKSANELESAMVELLTDLSKRKALAAKARHSIMNKYDQQKVWKAILNEYQ